MNRRGFTLIELLVVVAIIGILAAVVLSNLSTARGKSANTTIKAGLSTLRQQASLYYDAQTPTTYASLCSDTKIADILAYIGTVSGGTTFCLAGAEEYVVASALRVTEGTFTWWCVDSTNDSKGEDSAVAGSPTVCP